MPELSQGTFKTRSPISKVGTFFGTHDRYTIYIEVSQPLKYPIFFLLFFVISFSCFVLPVVILFYFCPNMISNHPQTKLYDDKICHIFNEHENRSDFDCILTWAFQFLLAWLPNAWSILYQESRRQNPKSRS